MRKVDYGRMLSTEEVIERIDYAMSHKRPFSLVRVGDGENIVLAQRAVMPLREVIRTRWGKLSRTTNRKGIRLPHLQAQDSLVKAIRRADIVGIPYDHDKEIQAPQKYLRRLTDKCFAAHDIEPWKVCHTFVNRHMVENERFWRMLEGRRIAIISRWAESFSKQIRKRYRRLHIDVVKTIPFSHHSQIAKTIREMEDVECDIVFISAGVNALILCSELKRKQGRVAIDFGKASMYMVTHNTKRVRPWKGGEAR